MMVQNEEDDDVVVEWKKNERKRDGEKESREIEILMTAIRYLHRERKRMVRVLKLSRLLCLFYKINYKCRNEEESFRSVLPIRWTLNSYRR